MRWLDFILSFGIGWVLGVLVALYTDLSRYWLIPIALAGAGTEALLRWMWKHRKRHLNKKRDFGCL
ncbi:MAG: hypothetical protein OXI24_03860 [Candidatus Poribacteria bacterium]|nr:hypothetical protein [Candidatus Poribacteria bacterium]